MNRSTQLHAVYLEAHEADKLNEQLHALAKLAKQQTGTFEFIENFRQVHDLISELNRLYQDLNK